MRYVVLTILMLSFQAFAEESPNCQTELIITQEVLPIEKILEASKSNFNRSPAVDKVFIKRILKKDFDR